MRLMRGLSTCRPGERRDPYAAAVVVAEGICRLASWGDGPRSMGPGSRPGRQRRNYSFARSMTLQAKVRRLDTTIHAPSTERAPIGNPLVPQLNRLKAAFKG